MTTSKQKLKKSKESTHKNRFISHAESATKTGKKRISNRGPGPCAVQCSTGEILGNVNFVITTPVDKTSFIKMYPGGAPAIFSLNKAGQKLFETLVCEIQKYPKDDELYINYAMFKKPEMGISRATYQRGIRSLIEKSIIAKSLKPNIYFLNVNYFFNGDRLSFLKEHSSQNT